MDVIKHCNEKLLLLKDHYIITDIGKVIAEPIHMQIVARIAEIKEQYSID